MVEYELKANFSIFENIDVTSAPFRENKKIYEE